ncbi:zinc-binding protein, partial [Halomonas sp. MCCC 1A11081]|nr:zinc-binding protein [Halomonas ethanolica]
DETVNEVAEQVGELIARLPMDAVSHVEVNAEENA